MNLPIAPPAFDATTGPKRRHRADLGADIAAGCGLMLLELFFLGMTFGLWFLSGLDLDAGEPVHVDSLWGYLAVAGGVGVVAVVAAAVAARAGAVVTVISQVVMAVLVCVCVVGGAAMQSHEDVKCRDVPSASGCDD
ncbi:DUF6234 family protein [Streptomyces melanogenes]|uniref:DUF6234 family protein n=1 Tax=Streptomyces melanogenes TaxID=67326 RepID=UPI00167CBD23|nr:DUF6234 family protein [Streptomyces melanogenes]GGP31870.1 hypothetical protein GCM10010278_01460 [Streptomyces melanogenes]